MKKLNKYVVPINIICYGEDEMDAVTYIEEALDNTSIIQEDGIVGAEIVHDDIELYEDEDYQHGFGNEEED
jgi:hypothetical protein